jgi:hypothetical protein
VGLILDSSVLIAAERKGSNARQVLSEIAGRAAVSMTGRAEI